jgi:hypothetical protein
MNRIDYETARSILLGAGWFEMDRTIGFDPHTGKFLRCLCHYFRSPSVTDSQARLMTHSHHVCVLRVPLTKSQFLDFLHRDATPKTLEDTEVWNWSQMTAANIPAFNDFAAAIDLCQ